jgi:hypothetical protein
MMNKDRFVVNVVSTFDTSLEAACDESLYEAAFVTRCKACGGERWYDNVIEFVREITESRRCRGCGAVMTANGIER